MARPMRHGEPLVQCSMRLPESIVNRLQAEARARNISRSDVARGYFEVPADFGHVDPTGYPTPIARPKLDKPKRADPELIRQLVAIGNNVNQLAHQVNKSGFTADIRNRFIAELQGIRDDIAALDR